MNDDELLRDLADCDWDGAEPDRARLEAQLLAHIDEQEGGPNGEKTPDGGGTPNGDGGVVREIPDSSRTFRLGPGINRSDTHTDKDGTTMSDTVDDGQPTELPQGTRRVVEPDEADPQALDVEELVDGEWVRAAHTEDELLDLIGEQQAHEASISRPTATPVEQPKNPLLDVTMDDLVEWQPGFGPSDFCDPSFGHTGDRDPWRRPSPDHESTPSGWRWAGGDRPAGRWVPPSWRGQFATSQWMADNESRWAAQDGQFLDLFREYKRSGIAKVKNLIWDESSASEVASAAKAMSWSSEWTTRVQNADFYLAMEPGQRGLFDQVLGVVNSVANEDIYHDGVNRTRTQAARHLTEMGECGMLEGEAAAAFLNDLLGVARTKGPGHMLYLLMDVQRAQTVLTNGLAPTRGFENFEGDAQAVLDYGTGIVPSNRSIASWKQGTWGQALLDTGEFLRTLLPSAAAIALVPNPLASDGIAASAWWVEGAAAGGDQARNSPSVIASAHRAGNIVADLTSGTGIGNCGPQAMVCGQLAHLQGYERVEVFAYGHNSKKLDDVIDHGWVVVNRAYGSDPTDPDTWGDAWGIIDSWTRNAESPTPGLTGVGTLDGIYGIAEMRQLFADAGRNGIPLQVVREFPRMVSSTPRDLATGSPPTTVINGNNVETRPAVEGGKRVGPGPAPEGTRPVLLGDTYVLLDDWMPPLRVVPKDLVNIGCIATPEIPGSEHGQRTVHDGVEFRWNGHRWNPADVPPPEHPELVAPDGTVSRWDDGEWLMVGGSFQHSRSHLEVGSTNHDGESGQELGREAPRGRPPSRPGRRAAIVGVGVGIVAIGGGVALTQGGDEAAPPTTTIAAPVIIEDPTPAPDDDVVVETDPSTSTSTSTTTSTLLDPTDPAIPAQSSQQTFGLNMSNGRVFPIFDFVIDGVTQRGIVMDPTETCWIIQYGPDDADGEGDCPPTLSAPLGATTHLLEGQQGRFVLLLRNPEGLLVVTDLVAAQGIEEDLSAQFFVTVEIDGPVEIDGEVFTR